MRGVLKFSGSLLLVALLVVGCKFNDPVDLTALPEATAPGKGLHNDIAWQLDTLYEAVAVPVPVGFQKDDYQVMPGLGVYLPFYYHNVDSSVTLEVTYTNRLSEGKIEDSNLQIASQEIEKYLKENQYADVLINEFETINNRKWWHFEAHLNWSGERLSTTIYACIEKGFLVVYNLRYPPSNHESSAAIRRTFVEKIVWL